MTIDQLNKAKIPIVKIDKNLEKFHGKVLFPEKLEEANKTLSKVGLPALPGGTQNTTTAQSSDLQKEFISALKEE